MEKRKSGEKKSETLDIRLPYEQKRAFMRATQASGETASSALRSFIEDYVKRAQQQTTANPIQELLMTLKRHQLKYSSSAAIVAAAGVFMITAMPSAADSAFDHLDANKDGVITEGEILPGEDADIIAKLDADSSGGVTPDELDAVGDNIIIKKTNKHADAAGDTTVEKRVKIIKLDADSDTVIDLRDAASPKKKVRIVKRGGKHMTDVELDALVEKYVGDILEGDDAQIDIVVD